LATMSDNLQRLVRFSVSEVYGPFACDVCGSETFAVWVTPEIMATPQTTERAHTAVRKGIPLCEDHKPNTDSPTSRKTKGERSGMMNGMNYNSMPVQLSSVNWDGVEL